jgi:uncharacterized protein DUF3289
MKLQNMFLMAAFAILTFSTCKKDILDEPPATFQDREVQRALQNLKTEDERNFFSWDFLNNANPYILPGIKSRTDEDSLVNEFFNYLLLLNQETNFAPGLIEQYGYPLWGQSKIYNDSTNTSDRGVLTPLARIDESRISSYVIGIPHSGDWYALIVTHEELDSLILQYPATDTLGLGFHVAVFLNTDERLFGTWDEEFKDWLWPLLFEDTPFQSGEITSRDDWDLYCELICPCPFKFQGEEEIEERGCSNCRWVCDFIIASLPTSGNGIGAPIGGGSSSGGGGGGGGSSIGTNSPAAVVSQIMLVCQQYAAANEPGGIPPNEIPGGYNPETDCKCGQFMQIQENLLLGNSDLLCLYEQANCDDSDKDAAQMISTYIENSAEPIDPGLIAAFLQMTNCGQEGMGFKAFQMLYELVVNVLKPELGLNQAEVDFLLSQPDVAWGISDFLDTYGNNPDATEFANYAIDILLISTEIDLSDLVEAYEWKVLVDNPSTAPAEEDVQEIQNGIEILSSYVPPAPPPNSVYIGGVPARGNVDDLLSGTNGNTQGINQAMVALSNAGNDDELFNEMTDLFHWTSMGALETVGDEFIGHFRNTTEIHDYHNPVLSAHVKDTKVMKNFIKNFGERLNNALQANGGDINSILEVEMPLIERPIFNSDWHKIRGYTILINDTEQTTVNQMTDFQINLNTGDWSGSFFFEINDHFGLDRSDVLKYQGINDGFAAWWLLQHVRGFIPFRTKIRVIAKIKGKINP